MPSLWATRADYTNSTGIDSVVTTLMHDRLIADFIRLSTSHRPVILFVTHRRGGGVERHVRELSLYLKEGAEVLVLRPYLWKVVALEWIRPDERFRLYFRMDRDYPALLSFLRLTGVGQVHFHHLFGHRPKIWNIAADIGVPFDITIHDYYAICPRISLTSIDNRYCGEPDEQQCNTCLQLKPHAGYTNIQNWRAQNGAMLQKAMRVFVPSEDTGQRIRKYYKDIRIVLAPHLDIEPEISLPNPKVSPLPQDEKLRIVVIGAMSQIKGADILEHCALLTQKYNLPLQFHLIGYAYKDMAELPNNVFSIHGEYADSDLQQLILESRPHVIWFPAQWPETYSYTLSAALKSGIPIVVPNIGALAERLNQRPWSWLCPWDWSADEWNNFFVLIKTEHFLTAVSPNVISSTQVTTHYRYQDYFRSGKRHTLTQCDLSEARPLLMTHCRTRFNLLERVVLNSRIILNPSLRFASYVFPIINKITGGFSPHNRKVFDAWLAGRWPS